jgi:hypothetical protein
MSGGYVYGSVARLWDGASGKTKGEPIPFAGATTAVAFSPDGRTIAIGGTDSDVRKGSVQLADAATGRVLGPPFLLPSMVWGLALSPDGTTLLTGCGDEDGEYGDVRRWDVRTGREVGSPLRHRGKVAALAYSPDGRRFASGSRDGTARLWDAATGEPAGPPMAHPGEVNKVAFSPDGRLVATAGDDGRVRFWSAATARPVGTPLGHAGPVNSVVFTPDGTTLITGGDDRRVRFWRVPAPVPGPVEPIKAWAESSSGLALSPEGAAGALAAPAWEARRAKRAEGPAAAPAGPLAPETEGGLSAHLRQAFDCAEGEHWPAALWHLGREIGSGAGPGADSPASPAPGGRGAGRPARPHAWLAHALRTQAHVQLAQFDQAAADFGTALRLGPPDQVLRWYRSYAAESADRGQWQAAFWYLDRATAARPGEAGPYADRARAYL